MSDDERHPVDVLAEEYASRLRAGEQPSIDEYARKHPEHAELIRTMFPSIGVVERASLRGQPLENTGSHDSSATILGRTPVALGDFQIIREIGRGGMGVVYEALQKSLKRRVALKVVGSLASGDEIQRERFRREAEAAAALHHTNIVPVFGIGEDLGLQYYAMQLIEGVPLNEVVRYFNDASTMAGTRTRPERANNDLTVEQSQFPSRPAALDFSAFEAARSLLGDSHDPASRNGNARSNAMGERDERTIVEGQADGAGKAAETAPAAAPLPAGGLESRPLPAPPSRLNPTYYRKVAALVARVANALAHAHHHGVLHRDIKPGNLLLDREGTVWVSDFGLARKTELDALTQSGEIVGTLKYMAPEQLRGRTDSRSDVYSLGVTLYELLTLKPAIESPQSRLFGGAAGDRLVKPRTLRSDIPKDLETVTLKACNADPRHRYQSAAEFESDLLRFLEDRPIAARPITPPERLWRWSRRNPLVASLSAVTLGLVLAIAALMVGSFYRIQSALVDVRRQYERAEVSLKARAEALAVAQHERSRAQTNLELAIQAFEGIVDNIGSRGGAESLLNDVEDADDSIDSANATLSNADVALLEKMLLFFDKFAQENATNLGMQSAKANRRVGDIQKHLGRLQDAEKSYQHALAIYRGLAKNQPADESLILLQAGVLNELTSLSAKQGDLPEATARYEEARKLLSTTPELRSSREGRFALAKTLNGFASIGARLEPQTRPRPLFPFRRPPPPKGMFGKNNAPVAARMKRMADANAESLKILLELVAEDPRSAAHRSALAFAYRDNVRICRFENNVKKAGESLESAIDLLEALSREFPDSDAFRYQLADTLCTSQTFGAEEAQRFARAKELCEELIAKQPNVPEYRALLGSTLARTAAAQFASHRKSQAIATMNEALLLQRELAKQSPDTAIYQVTFVQSLQNLADMHVDRKEFEAAAKVLNEAATYTSELPVHSRFAPMLSSLRQRLEDRIQGLQQRGP